MSRGVQHIRAICINHLSTCTFPENTPAQNARILAENQRDSLTFALTGKLAEAIENKKPERANAIAIILAQRLGYRDYRQLLEDIRRSTTTAPG
jgi:hypothetical protein